jgi:hypothetical protein
LAEFRQYKNVDFNEMRQVISINLSKNFLRNLCDLKFFSGLRVLKLNHNNIDDISHLEHLTMLSVLEIENNKITNINVLNRCPNINKLHVANNDLKYQTATLQTLQFLKITDLTISNNPFLAEIHGHKHFFIYKLKDLCKLDGASITDSDRNIAARYTIDNNQALLSSISSSRPNTAKPGVTGLRNLKSSRLVIDDEDEGYVGGDVNPNTSRLIMNNTMNSFNFTNNNNMEEGASTNKAIIEKLAYEKQVKVI